MKKNKILTVAIIFGLAIFVIFWQGNKVRSLEDCLLQVVKQAKTDDSSRIGAHACRKKFPEPNPFMNAPMKK